MRLPACSEISNWKRTYRHLSAELIFSLHKARLYCALLTHIRPLPAFWQVADKPHIRCGAAVGDLARMKTSPDLGPQVVFLGLPIPPLTDKETSQIR